MKLLPDTGETVVEAVQLPNPPIAVAPTDGEIEPPIVRHDPFAYMRGAPWMNCKLSPSGRAATRRRNPATIDLTSPMASTRRRRSSSSRGTRLERVECSIDARPIGWRGSSCAATSGPGPRSRKPKRSRWQANNAQRVIRLRLRHASRPRASCPSSPPWGSDGVPAGRSGARSSGATAMQLPKVGCSRAIGPQDEGYEGFKP